MMPPQSTTADRPASSPQAASPAPARPEAGEPPPAVLARADASEPAELAVVAVRGYN